MYDGDGVTKLLTEGSSVLKMADNRAAEVVSDEAWIFDVITVLEIVVAAWEERIGIAKGLEAGVDILEGRHDNRAQ